MIWANLHWVQVQFDISKSFFIFTHLIYKSIDFSMDHLIFRLYCVTTFFIMLDTQIFTWVLEVSSNLQILSEVFSGKAVFENLENFIGVNNKEYYFFQNWEFCVACLTIFCRMNYNYQIYYNITVSNDVAVQDTWKFPLLPWKLSTRITVTASFNLLHNDNKSDSHKFQKFQETSSLHLFQTCYHHLPRYICSCACIYWLF